MLGVKLTRPVGRVLQSKDMEPKEAAPTRPVENRTKALARLMKRHSDFYKRSLRRQVRSFTGKSEGSRAVAQSADTLVAKYQKQNGTQKLTVNQKRNVRRRLRKEGFQA